MNGLYYIRYFFYIAWNWNPRLAFFTLYHEIRGERKYGIKTSRLNTLQRETVIGKNAQHAEIYQGAGYYLLERTFEYLRTINAPDGFVDIGAGKGRAMVVAAYYGFKNIKGIEFVKALCIEAEVNCRQITNNFPDADWEVIHADAATFKIRKDMQVFFFFNPFKSTVMRQVIASIERSTRSFPRQVFIVYINPQLKTLFSEAGFSERIHLKKMAFVEAVIYEKGP